MGVFDTETDVIICQKMEASYIEACNEYNLLMHDVYVYINVVIIAFILAVFIGLLCFYFSERKKK